MMFGATLTERPKVIDLTLTFVTYLSHRHIRLNITIKNSGFGFKMNRKLNFSGLCIKGVRALRGFFGPL